jgi:hypothetical protein
MTSLLKNYLSGVFGCISISKIRLKFRKQKMKKNLISALLKKRNQYFLQLLVISILMLIFNSNEITFCTGIGAETQIMSKWFVYGKKLSM